MLIILVQLKPLIFSKDISFVVLILLERELWHWSKNLTSKEQQQAHSYKQNLFLYKTVKYYSI